MLNFLRPPSDSQGPLGHVDVEAEGGPVWSGPAPPAGPRTSLLSGAQPSRQMSHPQTPESPDPFGSLKEETGVCQDIGCGSRHAGPETLSTVVPRFGERIRIGAYGSVERAQVLGLVGPRIRPQLCLS